MRIISAALMLTLLAGCEGSPARYMIDREGEEKRMAVEDDAKCRGFGMQPGTPNYQNCRMQLSMQQAAERNARLMSAADDLSHAYQPPPQTGLTAPPPAPAPPNTPAATRIATEGADMHDNVIVCLLSDALNGLTHGAFALMFITLINWLVGG